MRILKWLNKYFEETLLVSLLGVIFLTMLAQIFARYVLGGSLLWSDELTRSCWVWVAFMSIPYCILNNRHLKVDTVTELLPGKIRNVLLVMIQIYLIALWGYLLYGSVNVVKSVIMGNQMLVTLKISLAYVYGAAIAGFAFGIFRTFQQLLICVKDIGRGTSSLVDAQKEEIEEAMEAS